MQFTQIPQQYAPLGQAIRYAVEQDAAGNLDARIVEENSELLLGAKRFAETTAAVFDIAPMLRRTLRFTPSTGATGFQTAAERCITVRVEALETGSEAVAATAPARTLLRRASDYLENHRDEFPEYRPEKNILNRCTTDGGFVQVR